MKRAVAVALAVAFAVTASGCASGSPGDLTAAAERVLVPEVEHVRQVAATGSYSRLVRAVGELETLVRQERDAGQVSPARAAAIMDAADALLQDASPPPRPTPSSSSPTPSASSSSPTPSASTTSPSASPTASSPSASSTASASPSGSGGSAVVSVSPGVP